jgi:hypothetical protein
VDETYVRVKGRWCYLYRAIDSAGAPIDFLLSAFRDADAAKRLFRKALSNPETRSSPNRFQSRHRSAMRIAAYGTLCRIVDNGILPSEFTVSDRGLTAEFAHGREGLTYRIFKLFRAPMEYLRSTTILVYRNHPAAPVAPACFLA